MGRLTALASQATNGLVRAGLMAYLARRRTSVPKNQNMSEDEKPVVNKQSRLLAFLAASVAFGTGAEPTLREQLLVKLVILAHHPEICECFATYHKIWGYHRAPGGNSRQVWIDLCHRAHLDPRAILDNQLDHLLKIIMDPSLESKVFSEYCFPRIELIYDQVDPAGYAEACYRATTTLAFIAPDTVLPRVMEQLHADLSLKINQLTDLDIGVWNTPEGQTFIDGEFQSSFS